MRPSLPILLVLALLLVMLPAGLVVAADEDDRRTIHDASNFRLASTAILAAQDQRTGSAWKTLDAEARSVIEGQIEWLKYARRELPRQMRRELARYPGDDEACERAAIRGSKKELDAELAQHLGQLRQVRGNHQKAFTRMHRSIQRDVLKPLGKLAKQALKQSLPELAATYLSGGAFSRAVLRNVVKRNVVRVVRREGQDLALRAVARKIWGPGATSAQDALEQACADHATASPAAGTADVADAADPPPAFAAQAWHLDLCTDSAQFTLEDFMPAPPYSQPYTLVRFDWPNKEAVMLDYFATSGDTAAKYPIYDAVMTAGCPDGLQWNNCGPAIPLVFTQADEAMQGHASNREQQPGQYTLAVQPKGACIYANDNGDWDMSYRYPATIKVTATIEHYQAGGTAPYAVEGPLRASVPFWSDDPFRLPLPGENRQVLGTFEWDPDLSPSPSPAVGEGSDQPAPWDAEGE